MAFRLLLPLAPEYIGYADLGVSDGMLCSRPALIERTGDGFFKYRLDTANLRLPDELGAICVSRPTNPSGNVLTTTELERLDAAARQRGVPLVIDAATYDAIQQGDPLTLEDLRQALAADGRVALVNERTGSRHRAECLLTPRERDILLAGGALAYTKRTPAS